MSIGRSILTFYPPPSPEIRVRRKQPKNAATKPPLSVTDPELRPNYRGRFETLFCQDVPTVLLNSTLAGQSERRERVEEELEENEGGFVEDKWGFQEEILRAECNVLRMEKEFALTKLERNGVQMDKTLRSAVQSLQTMVSRKEKICERKNVISVLEEEIEDLAEKLEELQRSSGAEDFEVLKRSNFDKKVSLLQHRRDKLGGLSDEKGVKEIRKMAEASLSMKTSGDDSFVLGHKRNNDEVASLEENKCSGRCKATVRRIIEQVRAEAEQWSQMQKMLGQVREEMESLQAARDFWEDRALKSDYEIQILNSNVLEWRHKAFTFENKANELQKQVSVLREELEIEKIRVEQSGEVTPIKKPPLISLGKHIQMEKRKLICRLKENHHTNEKVSKRENFREGRNKAQTCSNGHVAQKRSPLQVIGNSSPLVKQNSQTNVGNPSPWVRQNSEKKAIFPLHCPPQPSKTEESF